MKWTTLPREIPDRLESLKVSWSPLNNSSIDRRFQCFSRLFPSFSVVDHARGPLGRPSCRSAKNFCHFFFVLYKKCWLIAKVVIRVRTSNTVRNNSEHSSSILLRSLLLYMKAMPIPLSVFLTSKNSKVFFFQVSYGRLTVKCTVSHYTTGK